MVGLTYAFYQSLEKSEESSANSLIAIPQSAALILETDEIGDIWRDVSQTNIIWEELKATDFYFRLNEIGLQLDSMLVSQAQLRQFLADKPASVSAHISGARDYSFLMSIQLSASATEADIREGMTQIFKPEILNQRTYDGVTYFTFEPRLFDNSLHYYIHEGLLVLSLNNILIEESIRAMEQDASVLTDRVFAETRKTRGSSSRGHLYINYKQFKSIVAQYAMPEYRNMSFFEQAYADWSVLDLEIKADAINFSGFVACPDSSEGWLGAFKGLDSPKLYALDYMPSNTAYFAFLGFGNFNQFRKQQLELIEATKRRYSHDKKKNRYKELCDCDIDDYALNWIGSQAAFFLAEPSSEKYEQNAYAIFEALNPEEAREQLIALQKAVTKKQGVELETGVFKDYEIRKLPIGKFYGDILSEAFSMLSDPYFTMIDDMVLMANSENALRTQINTILLGKTLSKDDEFLEVSNYISDEAQFLLFNSLARSPFIYSHILAEPYSEEIEAQTEILRKFKAFVYQTGHYRDDLFYNNVYFEHSPEYQKETNSLWELELKADIDFKPQLIRNHYTDALEILIQDTENRLYLISNTGKIIWEKKLEEPIMSPVTQVDLYKNRKLQMAFNTPSYLYVLDRNGNEVEDYPVKLPAEATAPLGIADYDNSRDYRFFIPVKGGEILLYDGMGNSVEGWNFLDGEANIAYPVNHLRIRTKDYLFTYDEKGKTHLLNRRGDTRQETTAPIKGIATGAPRITTGKNIEGSAFYYVDSTGHMTRQRFSDRFDRYLLTDEDILDYLFTDLNGDDVPDCVILTPENIYAFNDTGEKLFSVSTQGKPAYLQAYSFSSNSERIGYTDTANNQIYLYTSKGIKVEGFPLYGSTAFSIGDLNRDGFFNLVVGGEEGFVYTYSVNQ